MENEVQKDKKKIGDAEEFEVLKVLSIDQSRKVEESPKKIGGYIETFMLELIKPGADAKSNGIYIARKGNHLEIGYAKTDFIR